MKSAQPLDSALDDSAKREAKRVRSLRWILTAGAAAMLAIGSVLIFLLALTTNNQTNFERYYEPLLYINIAVAGFFALILIWAIWRLVSRLRRGRFGSRLLIKLAAIFALVGFVPGVLIYAVSFQFVSRSIESWFNVQVEGALDAGLNLGRSTIDTLTSDLVNKTKALALQLSDTDPIGPLTLERLREQLGASDVILWSSTGQVLASAGSSRFVIAPERPSAAQMRQVRSARVLSLVEGLDEGAGSNARIKVIAAVSHFGANFGLASISNETRFVQVTQPIPAALVSNALAVQEAYKEYQQRALARDGLRNMYLSTLTLSLFLAMFGAVILAVLLGNQLMRPLLVLADGVAQVAAGDLRPKVALQTRDELGDLTRSFAQMTQQLSDARAQLQTSLGELDASRTHLQTMLDNLTAGVIVLDPLGLIVQVNPGATRVLQAPLAAHIGQPLASVNGMQEFAHSVADQFRAFFGEHSNHEPDHWQHTFELANNANASPSQQLPGSQDSTSIIARGAALPGGLRLLVFDDITEVVSAQRSRAWGEVARRLAHEIKNPLTPIQLSAERLEMKLQGKLQAADDALLTKSVKTIVDQVDAMKRLVNEFRDYARLPSAALLPLDLNALISEVLALYAPENSVVPVIGELDPACPKIMGDAQQLRQVIHNLLQNAQDAILTAQSQLLPLDGQTLQNHRQASDHCVRILTQYRPNSAKVRLIVRDQGTGFAPHILQRAFEPYVTTKVRGTGLGLAVVKKIADEHGARIELSNRFESNTVQTIENSQAVTENQESPSPKVLGAQVSLSFPVV